MRSMGRVPTSTTDVAFGCAVVALTGVERLYDLSINIKVNPTKSSMTSLKHNFDYCLRSYSLWEDSVVLIVAGGNTKNS